MPVELILYHRHFCPYSKRVRAFIEENHLESMFDFRDVEESMEDLEKLVNLTGGQQTPCLVINGRPKLDSDRIIEWIRGNLADLSSLHL